MTVPSSKPENSASICQWGSEVFGDVKDLKVLALRAQDELNELIDAIDTQQSNEHIALEAADVTILLHRLCGTVGFDLSGTVDKKMKINRSRNWTCSGNGVGEHISN